MVHYIVTFNDGKKIVIENDNIKSIQSSLKTWKRKHGKTAVSIQPKEVSSAVKTNEKR